MPRLLLPHLGPFLLLFWVFQKTTRKRMTMVSRLSQAAGECGAPAGAGATDGGILHRVQDCIAHYLNFFTLFIGWYQTWNVQMLSDQLQC